MKKIFTLMLVAIGVSFAASAQSRDGRYDQDNYPANQQNGQWDQGNRNQSGEWNRNDRNQSRDYGNSNRNSRYERQRQAEYERQRQAEYDRMNRDYDRRIDGYRKDRRMDRYERERQIQQAEYEREQKRKAFGNGVVVGGVAAIILGVLIGGGR